MKNNGVMSKYCVRQITYEETKPFILGIHYAHRMPSISFAYGLFYQNDLVGVITFGSPASPSLCKGIAGIENKHLVLELNRLVLKNNNKNECSFLISHAMKLLPQPKIIVSYADKAQNHLGTVYRATSFTYTGATKARTDMASANGKHSRHNLGDVNQRVERSSKHRFIKVIGNKREKRDISRQIKYKEVTYI